MTPAHSKTSDPQALDQLTHGAFSAPTSGERAARIREWLSTDPTAEQMQDVFRELQVRDKGAAKPLREKLDELKRAKGQEALAVEWAERANALLNLPRLNIADALAWQRDAAKAGAPLSKEPLSQLKGRLSERVKAIEDLQHRVQVQREAAVLLAQRIEVLSTKPWRDAQTALDVLRVDVTHWQDQAAALLGDAGWVSVDAKFPPLLEGSRAQLLVVWEAFSAALAQVVAAAEDVNAPLPPVPVWADEIRAVRGVPTEAPARPGKAPVDPEVRAKSNQVVREALAKLEAEVALGHGKASTSAAAAMRNALKEHGRLIDDKLDGQAHAALAAAGELEGWQRWRADQMREELVRKAEGLLNRPDGQALGGRKMQETLRGLRDQWKQTDQGGAPNHGLWKRFDEACNQAHKVVEAWLEKVKAESAEHRQQRLALIDELKAWTERVAARTEPHDWKAFNRALHPFADRWRDAGHVGEKAFAELQPLWKAAFQAAVAPLEAAQKHSVQLRQAMIQEAIALGEAPVLQVDAVKALQHRWQAEAQTVPLERKFEQKLWDSFRKPIDEAFNRKTQEREKAASALSERDRAVLEAAKALDAANDGGDAQKIRAAMVALDAALHAQTQATEPKTPVETPVSALSTPDSAIESVADTAEPPAGDVPAAPAVAPKAIKPVVAVRGDDRPGMKKAEPAPVGRGKPGERRDGARPAWGAERGPRGDAPARESRGPRLGDVAFRAQREAMDRADFALRKLAAQAHGETLTQLLAAWEQRDPGLLPGLQDLGRGVTAATRSSWSQAVGAASGTASPEALLRLEMAADLPTPADQLNARRALQLQLLTRRNEAAPAQTWGQDVAKVLAGPFDPQQVRRLQSVLKALLKR